MPDEKWVYFESSQQGTPWRVSSDGAQETQVAAERITATAISHAGEFLAYFSPDKANDGKWRLLVVSLDSQRILKTFALADETSVPIKMAWSINNESLTYITTYGSRHTLWRQMMDNDRPVAIADLRNEEIQDFALAPNGTTFGLIRGKWIHDAVLIEGLK